MKANCMTPCYTDTSLCLRCTGYQWRKMRNKLNKNGKKKKKVVPLKRCATVNWDNKTHTYLTFLKSTRGCAQLSLKIYIYFKKTLSCASVPEPRPVRARWLDLGKSAVCTLLGGGGPRQETFPLRKRAMWTKARGQAPLMSHTANHHMSKRLRSTRFAMSCAKFLFVWADAEGQTLPVRQEEQKSTETSRWVNTCALALLTKVSIYSREWLIHLKPNQLNQFACFVMKHNFATTSCLSKTTIWSLTWCQSFQKQTC